MNKPTFIVSCPIDTLSGYGSRSRDVVKALIELDKYDVKIIPQRWGETPQGFIKSNPEWDFLTSHIISPQLTQQPDIFAQITVPNEFTPMGKYNIGITAGIESTIAPGEWIEGCNRMDLILGSSKHTIDVLKNSKFEMKDKNTNQSVGNLEWVGDSEVLFEGADLDVYKPLKEPLTNDILHKSIDSIPEKFAYLFVGHWMQGQMNEDRKNVGLLIKAFYETFKNTKNAPALILKTTSVGPSYKDRNSILKKIKAIKSSSPAKILPNIYLLHGEFSDGEMNEIYNHSKVKAMVCLTKGEGFGRPMLEFSLVNKPIITTNWSGFSVDHGNVGHYLKDVFKNYKGYSEKAKRQGYQSRTNFSFDAMKALLDKILDNKIPEFPKQVQLTLPKLKKVGGENKPLELPIFNSICS